MTSMNSSRLRFLEKRADRGNARTIPQSESSGQDVVQVHGGTAGFSPNCRGFFQLTPTITCLAVPNFAMWMSLSITFP